jgi:DNA-binding transcriptional LysR family regulator
MKIPELLGWEAFLAVAQHGNLSRAARAQRLGLPQLSKRLARLEEQLGVRLFHRSTRSVRLSDEGRALLPRAEALLEDAENLAASFEEKRALEGRLRITCVPFVAQRRLLPALPRFLDRHPGLRIECNASESMQNLLEGGYDLALRIHHEAQDSSLVYRKLARNELVFCATPRYLKAAPPLTKPSDLRKHETLVLGIHRKLRFADVSVCLDEFLSPPRLSSDNGALLTEMGLQSLGVLLRARLDVQEALDKGRLLQVLKKHPLEDFGALYAVVPSRRLLAPRVRVFLDFLSEEAKAWT